MSKGKADLPDEQSDVSPSDNTSGQGVASIVPEEILGWNWGAFLLPPIWGISHRVWISLFGLILPIWFIVGSLLGAVGSELAWRNRRFEGGIIEFKQIQRKWIIWGIIFHVAYIMPWVIKILIRLILSP